MQKIKSRSHRFLFVLHVLQHNLVSANSGNKSAHTPIAHIVAVAALVEWEILVHTQSRGSTTDRQQQLIVFYQGRWELV